MRPSVVLPVGNSAASVLSEITLRGVLIAVFRVVVGSALCERCRFGALPPLASAVREERFGEKAGLIPRPSPCSATPDGEENPSSSVDVGLGWLDDLQYAAGPAAAVGGDDDGRWTVAAFAPATAVTSAVVSTSVAIGGSALMPRHPGCRVRVGTTREAWLVGVPGPRPPPCVPLPSLVLGRARRRGRFPPRLLGPGAPSFPPRGRPGPGAPSLAEGSQAAPWWRPSPPVVCLPGCRRFPCCLSRWCLGRRGPRRLRGPPA